MALGTPANEVQSTLATAFVHGTDSSIVLASGGGTNFPSTSQIARLTDGAHWCLLQYASKSTDTLTMTTATDYAAAVNVSSGDDAYTWPVGSTVELIVAADYLEHAIHDNVAGEIAAITEKTSPVAADKLLVEDSAASNEKKIVQLAHLAYGNPPLGQAGDSTWANRTYEGWEIFDTAHTYTVGAAGDFATLAAAASALQSLILVADPTVQLQEAITLTAGVVFTGLISAGGKLILDLNNYDITVNFDGTGITAKGPLEFTPRDLNAAAGNASIIAGASASTGTTLVSYDLDAHGVPYNINLDANSKSILAMISASNRSLVTLYLGTVFLDTGGGGTYTSAARSVSGAKILCSVTAGVSADDFNISSGGMAIDSSGHIWTQAGEWNTPDA